MKYCIMQIIMSHHSKCHIFIQSVTFSFKVSQFHSKHHSLVLLRSVTILLNFSNLDFPVKWSHSKSLGVAGTSL